MQINVFSGFDLQFVRLRPRSRMAKLPPELLQDVSRRITRGQRTIEVWRWLNDQPAVQRPITHSSFYRLANDVRAAWRSSRPRVRHRPPRSLDQLAFQVGHGSGILKLPRRVLIGLCDRLADPLSYRTDRAETLRWLNRQSGVAVTRASYYRFVRRFIRALESWSPAARAMPPRHLDTLRQLAVTGHRSKLFRLPPPVLASLCDRLVHPERGATVQALKWLRDEAGCAVSPSGFYRFAHLFARTDRKRREALRGWPFPEQTINILRAQRAQRAGRGAR